MTEVAAGKHAKPVTPMGAGVDWPFAAAVGARLAKSGPLTSTYTRESAYAELARAARRAEEPVRRVTGLADSLPVPEATLVDRPGWIAQAARSMAQMTGADYHAERGGVRKIVAKSAGLQVGGVLSFLSTAILGQYDPYSDDGDGTLLLVVPNIIATERAIKANPSDFRLWVCLHEVTHRVQFSANPWLADHMRELVAELGDTDSGESFTDALPRIVSELRSGSAPNPDPDAPGGVLGVMRLLQSPAQRAALDQLLVLGTVLEGHADHVMDAVGPAVVPSVASIRQSFAARRSRPQNPVNRILRALLGLDAKMSQYVRGKAFVDAVVAQTSMADFNLIWTSEETMPKPSEIGDPAAWVRRVVG